VKRALTIIVALALLTTGVLTGCGVIVVGSGNLVTETYDYDGFTKVEAHNGFQVEVTQANSYSIEVTTDDNVQEYLEVAKTGDTLRIGLKGYRSYNSITIEAKITMPDINGINLSGGSQGQVIGFSSSNDLSVTLSGGSGLEGDLKVGDAEFNLSGGSRLDGDVEAGDTVFDLSGGSRVTLSGSGEDLTIKSSGGSKATLESFPVNNADINISGGGSANINLSGTLSVDLSSGSKVIYSGEPKLGDIELSGGSTISSK